MANPIGSEYLYQNAVLKELARPSSERAMPSIETPAMDYAEGRSLADAAQVKLSSDVAFKKAALEQSDQEFAATLAERERQFMAKLLFAQDQLSTFSRQNDLANWVSVGNIAAQGVAGYVQGNRLAEQNKILQDIAKSYASLPQTVSLANAARANEWQTGVNQLPVSSPGNIPNQNNIFGAPISVDESLSPSTVLRKGR
ncbi:MAG: hypothetical protein A4E69_00328 [Syntrophus sp. PtaB.Bin138]|nr:MAG: hypothetical protein A4E69_00328 [Syntrophus sp. PtaB.Bin138]